MVRALVSAAFLAAILISAPAHAESKTLIVAGGCFWCVESDFDGMKGVVSTTSGYAFGSMPNPTYRNHGNHREAEKVRYDAAKTDYRTLIHNFLRTIDVTDAGGQFCDRGHSYTTAIYAANDEEAAIAKDEIAHAQDQLGRKIVTPVLRQSNFHKAEAYHQDYYRSQERTLTRFGYVTRADAYKGYRKGCGRDARVRQVWGSQAFQGVHHTGS